MSAVPTSDLNLDLCAQERIRLGLLFNEAGSIQPHGMLLVVDPDHRQIVQASANAAALLGDDRRAVLGLSLREIIGAEDSNQLEIALLNLAVNARDAMPDGGKLRIQTSNVVVVEDDADVRAFTVETVRELGYDVLEARDGNSALNVLRRTPAGKIDLLFSDVVHHGRLDPSVQPITKPFAFEDLAARLRSVLDDQDSSRHVN